MPFVVYEKGKGYLQHGPHRRRKFSEDINSARVFTNRRDASNSSPAQEDKPNRGTAWEKVSIVEVEILKKNRL